VLSTRPIPVSQLQPIGFGSQRYAFVHPDNPDLIIKVPHANYILRRSGERGKWYKKWSKKRLRVRHFLVFLREIKEHFAVRAAGDSIPPYMQTVVGFVETDIGMGVVTQAVRTADGELAPTLTSMLKQGRFDEAASRHLDEFFEWLLASPIVVGDLNPGNIVYGYDPAHGQVFVAIDGLGEKNLIPFNSMSSRMNRMAKLRRIRRMRGRIEQLRRRPSARDPDEEKYLRRAGLQAPQGQALPDERAH
jgi:hypothetical protein